MRSPITNPNHAEGQGRRNPASRAADRARMGAILRALTVGAAAALWAACRRRTPSHLLGGSTTNSNLGTLASTRIDTSCPGLQAANADLAKRPHLRAISTPADRRHTP